MCLSFNRIRGTGPCVCECMFVCRNMAARISKKIYCKKSIIICDWFNRNVICIYTDNTFQAFALKCFGILFRDSLLINYNNLFVITLICGFVARSKYIQNKVYLCLVFWLVEQIQRISITLNLYYYLNVQHPRLKTLITFNHSSMKRYILFMNLIEYICLNKVSFLNQLHTHKKNDWHIKPITPITIYTANLPPNSSNFQPKTLSNKSTL